MFVVLVGTVVFVSLTGVGFVVLVGGVVLLVGTVVFVSFVGGGATYLHYLALGSKTVLRGQFTHLEVDMS